MLSRPQRNRPAFIDGFVRLFQEVRRTHQVELQQHQFFASVSTYVAGPPKTATVVRLGATVTEGPFRVANHISTLTAGTRVLVVDTTGEGGFVVMAEIP